MDVPARDVEGEEIEEGEFQRKLGEERGKDQHYYHNGAKRDEKPVDGLTPRGGHLIDNQSRGYVGKDGPQHEEEAARISIKDVSRRIDDPPSGEDEEHHKREERAHHLRQVGLLLCPVTPGEEHIEERDWNGQTKATNCAGQR